MGQVLFVLNSSNQSSTLHLSTMKGTLVVLLLAACTVASQAKAAHKSKHEIRELLKELLNKKVETKAHHEKKQYGSYGPPPSGSYGPPPSGSWGPPPSGSYGPPGQFRCNDTGAGIPHNWVCDGYKDCHDCSDEVCGYSTPAGSYHG